MKERFFVLTKIKRKSIYWFTVSFSHLFIPAFLIQGFNYFYNNL